MADVEHICLTCTAEITTFLLQNTGTSRAGQVDEI